MPTRRGLRIRMTAAFLVDLALPVALCCGLRTFDVPEWLALVLSEAPPVLRLGYLLIRRRWLEPLAVCILVVVVCGTVITLLTGDVRLLFAREGCLTGLLGAWILGTLIVEARII